jgi:hypothetical protein
MFQLGYATNVMCREYIDWLGWLLYDCDFQPDA